MRPPPRILDKKWEVVRVCDTYNGWHSPPARIRESVRLLPDGEEVVVYEVVCECGAFVYFEAPTRDLAEAYLRGETLLSQIHRVAGGWEDEQER